MPIPCPNVRHPDFLDLEKELGREKAWLASHRNGGEPPTIERARELLEPRKEYHRLEDFQKDMEAKYGHEMGTAGFIGSLNEGERMSLRELQGQPARNWMDDLDRDHPNWADLPELESHRLMDEYRRKFANPRATPQELRAIRLRDAEALVKEVEESLDERDPEWRTNPGKPENRDLMESYVTAREELMMAGGKGALKGTDVAPLRLGASNPEADEDAMWAGFLKKAEQAKPTTEAVPSGLQSIYADQAKRSSSTMVDVQDTWKAYHKANPQATKAEFVEKMRLLAAEGKILTEPLENQERLSTEDFATLIPQKFGKGAFWKPAERTTLGASDPGDSGEEADYLRHFQPGANSPESSNEDWTDDYEEGAIVSIKNAATEALRKEFELMPGYKDAAQGFERWMKAATAEFAKNPRVGEELVRKLDQPGASTQHSAIEGAILTIEELRRRKAAVAARTEFEAAHASKDEGRIEAAELEWARAKDAVFHIVQATRLSGTEWGRAGVARQMALKEDYSIARMLADRRIANGGEPLTPAQEKETAELAKEIEATRIEAERADNRKTVAETKTAIKEMERDIEEEYDIQSPSEIRAVLADTLKAEADARRKARQARKASASTRLGMPNPSVSEEIDPEDFEDQVAEGLGLYVAENSTPRTWKDGMLQEFPEMTNEDLDRAYRETKRRYAARSKAMSKTVTALKGQLADRAKSGDGYTPAMVQSLAMAHVKSGVRDAAELANAVLADMKQFWPNLEFWDVAKMIGRYGKASFPSPDQDKRTLSELQTQLRLLASINVAQGGEMPARSGSQPGEKSDEVRRLEAQLREEIKTGKLRVTDPAKQLKTNAAAAERALQNRKRDLLRQIKARKRDPKKGTPERDESYRALQAEVESLDRILEQFSPREGVTDEQRVQNALNQINKENQARQSDIDRIDSLTRLGKTPKEAADIVAAERKARKASKTPQTEAIKQARTRSKALKDIYAKLQDAANPKLSQSERRLRNKKRYLDRKLKEVEDRIAKQNYAPRTKQEEAIDDEVLEKAGKLKQAQEKFEIAKARDIRSKMSLGRKALRLATDVRRGLMLSNPVTLVKIGAMSVGRVPSIALEQLAVQPWRLVPGISKIISESPRYHTFSIDAHLKGVRKAMDGGGKRFLERLNKGESSQEASLRAKDPGMGAFYHADSGSWMKFIGHSHVALKGFAGDVEYNTSLAYRMKHDVLHNINPLTEERMLYNRVAAYNDSLYAKCMQPNVANEILSHALQVAEMSKKFPQLGPLAADLYNFIQPIRKVPTNIWAERLLYLPTGIPIMASEIAFRMAANWGSISRSFNFRHDKATGKSVPRDPRESAQMKDAFMRRLGKTTAGAILLSLLAGFLSAGVAYYRNRKKKPNELKEGEIAVGGHTIPKEFTHHPAFSPFEMAATYFEIAEKVNKKTGEKGGPVKGAITAIAAEIAQNPYSDTAGEISKLINGEPKAFANFLSSMVIPGVLPEVAHWFDREDDPGHNKNTFFEYMGLGKEKERTPSTFGQVIQAKIPGARNLGVPAIPPFTKVPTPPVPPTKEAPVSPTGRAGRGRSYWRGGYSLNSIKSRPSWAVPL